MKKHLIIAGTLLMFAATSNAQDFKPTEGSKNLEFQFAPLGGSPINISGIRYRKFSSTTEAMRINAFLGYSRESTIKQEDGDNQKRLVDRESQFTINLRPGIEKHFEGTDRLSPYYGGEIDLGYTRTVNRKQTQAGADKVVTERRINDGDANWRFGLNAVAGFDYYFAKHLYIGAELGFGVSFINPLATRVKSDADGFKEPDPTKVNKSPKINFGPNVNSALRLGYLF